MWNGIINISAGLICKEIVRWVNDADIFPIIADETQITGTLSK